MAAVRSTRFLLAVIAIVIISVICTRIFRSQKKNSLAQPAQQAPLNAGVQEEVAAAPEPPISATSFHNTGQDVRYVGSDTCAECHSETSDAFAGTRHSESMAIAADVPLAEVDLSHKPSGYRYRSSHQRGRMHHEEFVDLGAEPILTQDSTIDYIVGSGEFGHSFLMTLDGFLVQSPLTWYTTRKEWDLSPGFESAGQLSFRRAVSAECLNCHGGIVEVQNENEFDVEVHEVAIGCERCHGPGSAHVDFQNSIASDTLAAHGSDPTIVNPARLPRELAESVCQQCHLQGSAPIAVRGRRFDSFRPGLPLKDFRQNYQLVHTDKMTIVGHVEQLHLSRCYQATETLTCTTCHSPHPSLVDHDLALSSRNACLQCHETETCTEAFPARQKVEDRCATCHMPEAPTEVPHVAFTHHRIGIHPVQEEPQTQESMDLISMLGDEHLPAADRDRCRGLAWLRLYLTHPEVQKPGLEKAQQLLESAWISGAQDAVASSALAQIAHEIRWHDMALLWANRALNAEQAPSEPRMRALQVASEVSFHNGHYETALQGFEELTRSRRDARHWFFRGLAEQNLGRTAQAIQSFEQSIAINPRNHGAHVALAAVYHVQGDFEKEQSHRSWAEKLQRGNP